MSPLEPQRRPVAADRTLRRGLAGLRSASPPPELWERIAAELPPPPGAAVAHRWRLSLPMATLAGVAILALLSLAGLGGQVALVGERPVDSATAASADLGLPPAELAIQPDLAPRPVDLTLPPRPRSWWSRGPGQAGWSGPRLTLSRALWPIPDPMPTEESVAPWFEARLR